MAQYNDSIAGGIRGTKRFRKDQKQFYSSKVDKSQTIYSNNTDLTTVGYNKFSDNATSQSYYYSAHQLFYNPLFLRYTDRYSKFVGNNANGTGSLQGYSHTSDVHTAQVGVGPQYKNKFYDKGVYLIFSSSLVGEGIKPGSFVIEDNSNGTANKIYIKDDKYGNLIASGSNFQISQSSTTSVSSSENYIGNIFYDLGIATITETGSYKTNQFWTGSGIADKKNYTASYKMTRTIRTLKWNCVVEPDEFNFTQNPTLIPSGNYDISMHGPDSRRYRYDITGSHHESLFTSFSIARTTGSIPVKFKKREFQPYITKIGLYNDNYELVCVATLPTPIKKLHNQRMIFEIEMDF